MKPLLAEWSASITDLKRNPSAILAQCGGQPVVILNHNRPAAYLVPAEAYEEMVEQLQQLESFKLLAESDDQDLPGARVMRRNQVSGGSGRDQRNEDSRQVWNPIPAHSAPPINE
jgi:antitoxin StbD